MKVEGVVDKIKGMIVRLFEIMGEGFCFDDSNDEGVGDFLSK